MYVGFFACCAGMIFTVGGICRIPERVNFSSPERGAGDDRRGSVDPEESALQGDCDGFCAVVDAEFLE